MSTVHGPTLPPKRNRKGPICFSPSLYRARNLVERFFNRIKQCRRVATRYDKLAANYLAFIKFAAIRIWLCAYKSTPLVVPTICFDLLYAFVIVRLSRRELIWINVTANPTAEWVARQITEAFLWYQPPRHMIRDRDCIYGPVVTRRLPRASGTSLSRPRHPGRTGLPNG